MLKRFRHMIMLAIVLFGFLKGGAQEDTPMPDYVCVGATKHYHVDANPVPGSTYTWKINGVTQISTTNEIDITWGKPPGKYTLTVQERAVNGCQGTIQTGDVTVKQWNFSVPPALEECVENISSVSYSGTKIITDQPDYYSFSHTDKRLDISEFTDYCQLTCPFTIRWQIDFSPIPDLQPPHNMVTKPSVSGVGQPSETIGSIQFPGDGLTLNDVVHTITYWIKDCAGNESLPHKQNITIKPRPNVLVVK